jgi:hypothetical protein
MIDLNPSIGPDAVYSVMKNMAVDMDDPATLAFDAGFDCGTGFGLIEAEAALLHIATAIPASASFAASGSMFRYTTTTPTAPGPV